MITDIDPYFVAQSTSFDRTAVPSRPALHRATHYGHSGFSQSRAAREALFEQAHGSLWVPGLLDRLTSPLTRYHE